MADFNPRALDTGKGLHPDLVRGESGELEFRPTAGLPPGQRRFIEMWTDDAKRRAWYSALAAEQALLPEDVQTSVAGRAFGTPDDPYSGWLEYQATIGDLRRYSNEITSRDVEKMDAATFDRYFDERGKPREGVTFVPTVRDIDVSDGGGSIDRFSARELRNRG